MGSKTKLVTTSIKDNEVKEDNFNDDAITTAKLAADSVESSEINDGTVTADDLASTLDLSSKTVTLPNTALNTQFFNISLLGFKMAVNESLTVFNLVDGVVDEFHDESGTDEAEGSNDNYCASSDFYDNVNSVSVSAGFAITSVTEADTSTAGTNPAQNSGTAGTFTVPTGLTSLAAKVWGSGGGSGTCSNTAGGGGGGFSSGTLAVTPGQAFTVSVGEGGEEGPGKQGWNGGGIGKEGSGSGGGFSGLISPGTPINSSVASMASQPTNIAFIIAGSGGGADDEGTTTTGYPGGAGGGLTGQQGAHPQNDSPTYSTEATITPDGPSGGGGDQEQGGQGGPGDHGNDGSSGAFLSGGASTPNGAGGGGGSGYYGGGGAGNSGSNEGSGGGGSSYYGHPQITSGATEAGDQREGGGTADPAYVASTNEGTNNHTPGATGEDGYVLLTGSACLAQTTFIASNAFAANSVPTTSRIVVFEEDIESPTLNTDVVASISRDGGSTFTTATLADSGYVTGSSGQRILTGQVSVAGQPSGQSMRWKLTLQNKKVKIHGVSLAWA